VSDGYMRIGEPRRAKRSSPYPKPPIDRLPNFFAAEDLALTVARVWCAVDSDVHQAPRRGTHRVDLVTTGGGCAGKYQESRRPRSKGRLA